MKKDNFLDLERSDIERLIEELKLPAYKAGQIYRWQSRGISSFDEMSDQSKEVRSILQERWDPGMPELLHCYRSEDTESMKLALSLSDAQIVETVVMQHHYGTSLCLSTQAGCSMGCAFCASSQLSFGRNMTRGELLGQLLLSEKTAGKKIQRIDLMGIGEPLANYREVVGFIRKLKDLLDFSPRKITLSTCGIIPRIRELGGENLPVNLAISLHAPRQELRVRLMPIARQYPLEELISAADDYFRRTGRRVSYEYALFAGVNDSLEDARQLSSLLRGKNSHVNLIPANAVSGSSLRPSSPAQVKAFSNELERKGIPVSIRRSLGQDIEAACGQLRRSCLLAGQS